MANKRNWIKILILLVSIIFITTACNKEITTEEIIQNIIKEDLKRDSYNLNMDMDIISNDMRVRANYDIDYMKPKLKLEYSMKLLGEEVKAKSIYDGKKMKVFIPDDNILIEDELDKLIDFIGIDWTLLDETEEEQIKKWEDILDKYKTDKILEEQYNDRDVYKLELLEKENKTNDEDLDTLNIWVDKKEWIILKQEEFIGDDSISLEVNEYKDKKFSEDNFSIEIPENTNIMNYEEYIKLVNKLDKGEQIAIESLEDIEEGLLYFPKNSDYKYDMGFKDNVMSAFLYIKKDDPEKELMITVMDIEDFEDLYMNGADFDEAMKVENWDHKVNIDGEPIYINEEIESTNIIYREKDKLYMIFDYSLIYTIEELVEVVKTLEVK